MPINIEQFLLEVSTCYQKTRRAGHTQLIKKGLEHYDSSAIVVALNSHHVKCLQDSIRNSKVKTFSFQNLPKNLQGRGDPLVFDNASLDEVFRLSLKELQKKQKEIVELRKESEGLRSKVKDLKLACEALSQKGKKS